MLIRYKLNPEYTNEKQVYLNFWKDIFSVLEEYSFTEKPDGGVFRFNNTSTYSYDIEGLQITAKRYLEPVLNFKSEGHETFYPDINPMYIFNALERMFHMTKDKQRIIYDMVPDDIGEQLFNKLKLQDLS